MAELSLWLLEHKNQRRDLVNTGKRRVVVCARNFDEARRLAAKKIDGDDPRSSERHPAEYSMWGDEKLTTCALVDLSVARVVAIESWGEKD